MSAGPQGGMVYFTGKPCKRGHIAGRHVSNKTCSVCVKLAYAASADIRRAGMKAWRDANPGASKAASKRWKDANRDACRAIDRNRKARKRAAGGSHTAADVRRIYLLQRGRCANCEVSLGENFHADHVVPLAKGGSNDTSNIQCLCPSCNHKKHARLPHEWAAINGRLL